MELSVFDSMGPIMIGPSSSHTAGAVRIGFMARHAFGEQPSSIGLSFHSSLMLTYKGHRTDTGLVAGLLGFREDDEAVRSSLREAKERGVSVEVTQAQGDVHPNTMAISLESPNREKFDFTGISVGGGSVLVPEIDGYRTNLDGRAHVVLIWREGFEPESWGVEGKVSRSEKPGSDLALTVILMDKEPGEEILQRLQSEKGVKTVRYIPPVTRFVRRIGDVELPFITLSDLEEATRANPIVDVVLRYESERTGASAGEIRQEMSRTFEAMRDSVKNGLDGSSQLVGGFVDAGDAKRLWNKALGDPLVGSAFTKALARALAGALSNAAMGKVVASPTAGSAGVVAGVVLTLGEERNLSDAMMVDSLLVAAGVGVGIGHVATFSGAVGGCQAEIGVASAMAAAAGAYLGGGDSEACLHAAAFALKNILGLACDPACGPVEVPCVKRNAIGVTNALAAAEMALAGVRSAIPPGEVALALKNIQDMLPEDLRDNTLGGIGSTPTAAKMKKVWAQKVKDMID